LIRGENSESIRVLVAAEQELPETPARLESISLLRWSLVRYLESERPIGWYWNSDAPTPWHPLRTPADLAMTYAVCLQPEFAGYTPELGLYPGQPGSSSPRRTPPPRPGYAALKEELWTNHAQLVAAEAEQRIVRDGVPAGLFAAGCLARYGIDSGQLRLLVRICGLLHDLGKLQTGWQQWAESYQKQKYPDYKMPGALAHTDFDYDNAADRECARFLGVSRPPHACASAFFCLSVLEKAFDSIPADIRPSVASACVAAIISHHGAFLPTQGGIDIGILPLIANHSNELAPILDTPVDPALVRSLANLKDKRGLLSAYLKAATDHDALENWWPLVAYLMRNLRLSDQRATSEWSCHE
jgi:CRISPR-associated endonuclease Cas3-HD